MIDKAFAEQFAADWIASWNAHDLARILAHYADDFEMSSPVIIKVAGEPTGVLKGSPFKVTIRHIGTDLLVPIK